MGIETSITEGQHPLEQRSDRWRALFDPSPVLVAYLFGSRARGDEGSLSDIDIGVLLQEGITDILAVRLELLGHLSKHLRTDRIDLVVLNEASPLLRHRVVRDGKLLYCRDDRARLRFVVRSVMEYLDFLPYRQHYQRTLFRRIRENRLARGS